MKDPNPGIIIEENEEEFVWVGNPSHYEQGDWALDAEHDVEEDTEDYKDMVR